MCFFHIFDVSIKVSGGFMGVSRVLDSPISAQLSLYINATSKKTKFDVLSYWLVLIDEQRGERYEALR